MGRPTTLELKGLDAAHKLSIKLGNQGKDDSFSPFRLVCQQVVRALTDLKIIVSRGDDLSLRRAITYFLDNIARQTQEQETIAAIGEDIFAVALDQPFRSELFLQSSHPRCHSC